MKFFKTIWFPVLLSIVITVSIVFVMMNNVLNKKAQEQAHGAPSEPVAPTSPVKYPGKLTDELRNFVAELEARDAEVRQKEAWSSFQPTHADESARSARVLRPG